MIFNYKKTLRLITCLCIATLFFTVMATPGIASGYDNSLKGVNSFDAVYQVTQGNPKIANIVFWAIKNSYEVAEVKALPQKPKIAIVFHGPAVKLLSSNKAPFNSAEWIAVDKFQKTLQEMKKDGVTLEVCLYAAKVMGVEKDTILPEVDQVGNGFVSVIGYQMQDYAVVRIP